MRHDAEFDKNIDLEPDQWRGSGRELPPEKPKPGNDADLTHWVSIIVIMIGLEFTTHETVSHGWLDFFVACLFGLFCLWNYWPRAR
jgi:hypothetical protein